MTRRVSKPSSCAATSASAALAPARARSAAATSAWACTAAAAAASALPRASSRAAPVAPTFPLPVRQPVAEKRSPSRVTATRPGWAMARSRRRLPRGHGDGGGQQAVEQPVETGQAGPHVVAHGFAADGGGQLEAAGNAGRVRGRSTEPPRPDPAQLGQGLAGAGHAVDHHGGDGLAGRRLERRLPAVVDLDHLEQGADHAVDVGQALGARPGHGPRRGRGPGLRPAPPTRAGRSRRLGRRRRRRRRGLGGHPGRLGLLQGRHQGPFGHLGLGQLGPQALGFGGQAAGLLVQRLDARLHARHLTPALLDAGAQGRQLAPRLGRLVARPAPGRRRPSRARTRPARRPAPPRPRPARRPGGQAGRPRRRPPPGSAGQPGGLGLQAGDHGPVDGGLELGCLRPAALGQQGGQAPGRSRSDSKRTRASPRSSTPGRPMPSSATSTSVSRRASAARSSARGGGQLGPLGRGPAQSCLQPGDLAAGQVQAQGPQLVDQAVVATGRVGLALERAGAGGAPRAAGPGGGAGCPRWRRGGAGPSPAGAGTSARRPPLR